MKYLIPCLLVLLLILIFYPNDYDEAENTIYIENNKYYVVYDRQNIFTVPDVTAIGAGGRSGTFGVRDIEEWIMPYPNK